MKRLLSLIALLASFSLLAQPSIPFTPYTFKFMTNRTALTAREYLGLTNLFYTNYYDLPSGPDHRVVYKDDGELATDPGFEYLATTDTLWVPNVNISLTGRFNFCFVTNATIYNDASPETPALGFQFFSKDVAGVSQPWMKDKAGTERRLLVDHSSQYARDVWIAVRTDGLPGSGIETDPYDGSTRTKFDAVMNTLRTDGVNQNIRLFPGTYFTMGSQGWSALAVGDSLYGAGIQKTILVGTNYTAAVDNAAMVNCNYEGGLPGRVIRDLTLDCNQPAKLGGKITGISIWKASDILIENVEVLRLGGTTTNYESFGINLMQVTNAVVNNCIVQSNTSGYIGAIGVGGQNVTVSKCSVKFNTDVTDKRLAAYGMSGSPSSDLRFIGNFATNALYGWWCDTGDTIDNIQFLDNIIHTTGINGGGGVSVYLYCGASGPYYSNVQIRNNLFSGSATNHGIYLGMGSYGFFDNVRIEGNYFTCGVPTSDTYGLSLRQATNVTVANNVFSENLHHFSFLACDGLSGYMNRTPAGNPISALGVSYLPLEAGANVTFTTNGAKLSIAASGTFTGATNIDYGSANSWSATNLFLGPGNVTNVGAALALKAPITSASLVTPSIGVATGTSLTMGTTNVTGALAGKAPNTFAGITNALGIFTGVTTTFLRANGTMGTPAGSGTVSNLNTLTYGYPIVGGGAGGILATNAFGVDTFTFGTGIVTNTMTAAMVESVTNFMGYGVVTNNLSVGDGTVAGNLGAVLAVGSTTYVDLNFASATNAISGALTIVYATNGVNLIHKTQTRWLFNGSGSDQTLTIPTGWRTNVYSAVPTKLTNATVTKLILESGGPTGSTALQTNCYVSFEYFK